MISYTTDEHSSDNTEKFFKLIGWKQRMPVNVSGWWQQPDGEYYPEEFLRGGALPSIETDCNEFFKYVIPEMFKKGFGFTLENNPFSFNLSESYKFSFWGKDSQCLEIGYIKYGDEFLKPLVQSAINCLEPLKD